MEASVMNKVNVFANEFLYSIMEREGRKSGGYKWEISFCYDNDEQECEIYTKVQLCLCDGDGEEIGSVFYDMVRDKKMRYAHTVSFSFEEGFACEYEEVNEFKEIKDAINMCEEGLYDSMCTYLNKYAMKEMEVGVDMDASYPPTYEEVLHKRYWL